MIDVHCHLNFHKFDHDYEAVIQRAHEKGVTRIINVGTSLESSQQAVAFAEKYENLYAIVGIHPHHADKMEGIGWITQLEQLATHPKVVGIGEIGLDYFSYQSNGIVDPNLQKQVFIEQINIAERAKLPLQIHNRLAGEDILTILNSQTEKLLPIPGMFHCFASTRAVHQQALALGFYIGFDGNSTYPGLAPKETVPLPEFIAKTPLERILCETDSPYLTPIPYRGQRNEPANVILVGETIAQVKGLPFQDVVEQTTKNAYTLFTKLT